MYEIVSSETILPLIYSSHIREQLIRFEELRNNRVIYVTELVSCSHKHRLRQIYPELTISFEPTMITGHLIHIGVEKYLADNGFQTEYPVEKTFEIDNVEYVLKGRVDAYHPEKKIIVEVKSSRNARDKPLEHHVEQLQIYLNLLNVDTGVLLYITPVVFREYRVERKEIDLANLVKSTIRNEHHPRWSWECKYCVFRKICSYRIVEE
ncbi:MAG: CRISPR-associated protein Cas4 [Desulfurococcaceae archaeon]